MKKKFQRTSVECVNISEVNQCGWQAASAARFYIWFYKFYDDVLVVMYICEEHVQCTNALVYSH